jgi:hypothetical protein
MIILFEWDPNKNKANEKKHGIQFEEAQTTFLDVNARMITDPDHSEAEERFLLLGLSEKLRLLVVCHCYRSEEGVIRIISARKATRREWAVYEEFLV